MKLSSRQSNVIRRFSAFHMLLARWGGGYGMGMSPSHRGDTGGLPPGKFKDLKLRKVHFGAFWEMIVP